MKMTKIATLVSAAALAMAAMPASAVLFSVPGGSINIPTGFDIQVASTYENAVLVPGDELRGVGAVLSINGQTPSALCGQSCELTIRFTSYILDTISPTLATFKGGKVDFYLGFGANVDFNPFTSANSAADLAAATNGAIFLNVIGHAFDGLGHTLQAQGVVLPPVLFFTGSGFLDVDTTGTGVANSNFNSNAIMSPTGPADFALSTSGNSTVTIHPAEGPCFTLAGAPTGSPECITGSATIQGVVLPEPGTLALLGLGLAGLGFGAARRRKTVA